MRSTISFISVQVYWNISHGLLIQFQISALTCICCLYFNFGAHIALKTERKWLLYDARARYRIEADNTLGTALYLQVLCSCNIIELTCFYINLFTRIGTVSNTWCLLIKHISLKFLIVVAGEMEHF